MGLSVLVLNIKLSPLTHHTQHMHAEFPFLNPFQAACLLLFNDTLEMSFGEVMERLNLPEEDTIRTLHSLSCGK